MLLLCRHLVSRRLFLYGRRCLSLHDLAVRDGSQTSCSCSQIKFLILFRCKIGLRNPRISGFEGMEGYRVGR